jgi:hypothetical protein
MLSGGTWPRRACSDGGRRSSSTGRGAAAVGYDGAGGRDGVGRAQCNGGRRMASRRVGRAKTRTNTKGRTITQSKTRTNTRTIEINYGALTGPLRARSRSGIPRQSGHGRVTDGQPCLPGSVGARGSGPPGVAAGPRAAGGQDVCGFPDAGIRDAAAWWPPSSSCISSGALTVGAPALSVSEGACWMAPPIAVRRRGRACWCAGRSTGAPGPSCCCTCATESTGDERADRARASVRASVAWDSDCGLSGEYCAVSGSAGGECLLCLWYCAGRPPGCRGRYRSGRARGPLLRPCCCPLRGGLVVTLGARSKGRELIL